jgi:hypothetical protein
MEISEANLRLCMRAPLSRSSFQAALRERRTALHSSSSAASSAADISSLLAGRKKPAATAAAAGSGASSGGADADVVAAVRAELDKIRLQIHRGIASSDASAESVPRGDGGLDEETHKLAVMHKYLEALAREISTKTVQWRKDGGGSGPSSATSARGGILSQSLSSAAPAGGSSVVGAVSLESLLADGLFAGAGAGSGGVHQLLHSVLVPHQHDSLSNLTSESNRTVGLQPLSASAAITAQEVCVFCLCISVYLYILLSLLFSDISFVWCV